MTRNKTDRLLSNERKQEIFVRCFQMVDQLNEMATESILNMVETNTCPVADRLLRNSPEIIALKPLEQAIIEVKNAFRKPHIELN